MADVGEIYYVSEDESEDDDDSDLILGDPVASELESGSDSHSEHNSDDEWNTQEEPGVVEPGGLAVFGKFCTKLCEYIENRVNSGDIGYGTFSIPGGKVEVGLNSHVQGGIVLRTPPNGVMVLSHSAVSSKFHYQDQTHWAKVVYTPMISQETQTVVNNNIPETTQNTEESTSETA